MKRTSIDKSNKEGYYWFRIQESKLLALVLFIVSILLLAPIIFSINYPPQLFLLFGIFLSFLIYFSFTLFYISREDDGIYFSSNRGMKKKLISWNEQGNSILFESTPISKGLLSNNIRTLYAINGDDKDIIYLSLCIRMSGFFKMACTELAEAENRRRNKSDI